MDNHITIQAEKISLLARDLTLFPESMDSVLAAHNLDRNAITSLENNPVFQSACTHALQQLMDDPLYPRRLLMAAQASILAEKLLNEAISGTMDHQNSIKTLEYASKVANMEPPKVTRSTNTNSNMNTPTALDPTAYRTATAALTDDEIAVFELLLNKMQGASVTAGE